MIEAKNTYVSLEALAGELGLPKSYLKDLAASRSIPCLNVNGRLRFDSVAVRRALHELASTGGNHE